MELYAQEEHNNMIIIIIISCSNFSRTVAQHLWQSERIRSTSTAIRRDVLLLCCCCCTQDDKYRTIFHNHQMDAANRFICTNIQPTCLHHLSIYNNHKYLSRSLGTILYSVGKYSLFYPPIHLCMYRSFSLCECDRAQC